MAQGLLHSSATEAELKATSACREGLGPGPRSPAPGPSGWPGQCAGAGGLAAEPPGGGQEEGSFLGGAGSWQRFLLPRWTRSPARAVQLMLFLRDA